MKKFFYSKMYSIKSSLILFSLVPCFILMAIISIIVSHNTYQEEIAKVENNFSKAVVEINSALDQAMNFSTNIISSPFIVRLFNEYQTGMNSNYEAVQTLDMFFFNYHENPSSSFKKTTIYHDNYSMYRNAFSNYIDVLDQNLLNTLKQLNTAESLWYEDSDNYYLYKAENNHKYTVIVEYCISKKYFDKTFEKFEVYTNEIEGCTNSISYLAESQSRGKIQRSLLNGKVVTLTVPKSLIKNIYYVNSMRFLLLFALFAILLINFANLFSNKLKKRIATFVDDLICIDTKAGAGEINSNDDILTPIYHKLVELTNHINDVNTKNNLLVEEKHMIELTYLQSKFNPHLFYNILSVLKWECIKHDETLADAIDSMSDYYRSCISDYNDVVELREEIDLIKKYINLMEFVHKRKYALLIDIDNSLLSLKTIKHLLQPFVENSILHGISHNSNGYIKIVGNIEGDCAIIKIIDNGYGINSNRITEIQNNNYFSRHKKNYGIKSTRERIKLFHGENSDIKIENRDVPGVCITITIDLK